MPKTDSTLKAGQAIPEGEPRRFLTKFGYVLLRWKTALNTYVTVKEHRFVMGLPPGHLHVHHKNGIRHDNRPENLEVLTPRAHFGHHTTFPIDEALAEYQAGTGLVELGRKYGVHHVSIMRTLKMQRGLKCRPCSHPLSRPDIDGSEVSKMYMDGVSVPNIAKHFRCTPIVIRGMVRRMNLPARGRGWSLSKWHRERRNEATQ